MTPIQTLSPNDYAIDAELQARLFSPSLIIYMDKVRHNLRAMLAALEDKGGAARWRPHLKTSKIPEVYAEIVAAGVRQFKCATPREAAVMLQVLREQDVAGDLLIAYPHREPALSKLAVLAERYSECRLSVLCEDPAHVAEVPERLGIFIDVNPTMDRTGIPLHDADAVIATAHAAGSRLGGLHFYDGHIKDADAGVRRAAAWTLYDQLGDLLAQLAADGVTLPELITSGTPSFLDALAYAGFAPSGDGPLHRVSPGTVVYHDLNSEPYLGDVDLRPAALVFSRVISYPRDGRITCDAGSKALAAEVEDPIAAALGWPQLCAAGPSEEHLPMALSNGSSPPRGEALLLVPRHVCPTVNLAEQALLIESGRAPRAVSVAARAHDLLWDG